MLKNVDFLGKCECRSAKSNPTIAIPVKDDDMMPCFNWCWRELLLGSVVIGQPEEDHVFDASSSSGTWQLMVVF